MLIEQITLRNLLSFKDATIRLRPLNILIGENTAGKSNLIESIGLLQAAPVDLLSAILRGGGVHYWLWLGDGMPGAMATLKCAGDRLTYELEFSEDAYGMYIARERFYGESGEVHFARSGQAVDFANAKGYSIQRVESVFALFKNPADPTPITRTGRAFEKIRIFREFQTGLRAATRQGVATTVQGDFLRDGGDNLATVLQELDFYGAMDAVRKYLNRFAYKIDDVRIRLDQGVARTFLRERGFNEPLPSVRMSDGTLKFLCLLAILLHPSPPPLVCIEEPEQGLHPDAVQIVAEAMKEAAERTQLIVTTHSRDLVDAFSDDPESVLVCERDAHGGTQCRRLESAQLDEWLEQYSLGAVWRAGEIGGNRW